MTEMEQETRIDMEHGTGRILIVDDDKSATRLMERYLSLRGHEFVSVHDGTSAIMALSESQFNVVLTDLLMPGMSGLDLLRSVRKTAPETAVVLVTANPSVDSASHAIDLGATHYVCKPLDKERFLKTVDRAFDRNREETLNRRARAFLDQQVLAGGVRRETIDFDEILDSIRMAYQPIYRVPEGRLEGYEALLRSVDPAYSNPSNLLALAESMNRIVDLGRTVRGEVATMLSRSPADTVFINLHSLDLADPQLGAEEDPLTEYAGRVVLELTERAQLELTDETLERIADLRTMGFRIAIDDLGAGYSSLASLATIDPDIVKLDMSMIRDIHNDRRKQRLLEVLVRHLRDAAVSVVAEGIEKVEELDVILGLDCNLVQGYLLGKPAFMPAG